MEKEKILIVDDDPDISEILSYNLVSEGYETVRACCAEEAFGKLSSDISLILLDVMMGGMSGYRFARTLRSMNNDIPVIFLTAKNTENDMLTGFSVGADDYISKPFSPTELVARVKANLAQYDRIRAAGGQAGQDVPSPRSAEIQIGNVRVNSQTHRVYVDDNEVDCKHREYELLLFMMQNPEIVFSKEQLYERIWGMDALGDIRTVAVHINRLREKIEKDPANPTRIQTVWGAGYRFKA